ncbi:MAG: PQQ-binding-like beta-propeller repeat protein [Caldilineaceae bacterium]|nr:PQQ-binding-like beta-propeller repeat protein [Caldilineaceae bacterium]MCB0126086.1 PQQ-binding-like beta-propeller repeat protein [Caldilineaceae bacterium]
MAPVPWPMEGGNAGRTRTTTESIQPPLTAQERFEVGGDTRFVSPIALAAELLVADGDRRLHAFDLTNSQEIWRVVLPGSYLSPTIAGDSVYIRVESGEEGFLIALDRSTGEERWNYRFPAVGSAFGDIGGHVTAPSVVGEQLFVGAAQTLNAFDIHTGTILWQFSTDEPLAASVAVANNIVYLADFTHLYAVDQRSGVELWRFEHDTMTLFFAPVVTEQAVIVADQATIYALTQSDGHPLWQRRFDQEIIPAAASSDHVYVKTVNHLWALDPTNGDIVWDYQAQNFVSLPAVTAEQLYIITRSDGGSQLRALRRTDGMEIWQTDNQSFGNSAPVATHGTVYVRTVNGSIVGYRP